MEYIKKNKLSLFCLVLFLSSCNTLRIKEQCDKLELSSMVNDYYYHYGEYPSSLDAILLYYEVQDSVNATINYLYKRKQDIDWTLNNQDVIKEELVIKEKEDTLFWYSGKKHLPYLDDLINGYEKDYLEYPSSLYDLVNYNHATKGKKEEAFDRCIDATLSHLEKYNDKLIWKKNDSLFLLEVGNDTISCRIGPSYESYICESAYWKEKVVFLFFDNNGVGIFNDDMLISFKKGLQELRKTYKDNNLDHSDYHVLLYTTTGGLQLYCKNDTLLLNTEWFNDVETYLKQFSLEHNIWKIVFISPSYRK